MTETTLADPLLGEAWRYPELAVTLRWSDRVTDLVRARLIAKGLAGRYTPESAVRYLIDKGEFAVAETVLTDIDRRGLADGGRVDRLRRGLETQRQADTDEMRREAWLLRERAERIGIGGIDVAAVIASAIERRADAKTHLETWDERIRVGRAAARRLHPAGAHGPAGPARGGARWRARRRPGVGR